VTAKSEIKTGLLVVIIHFVFHCFRTLTFLVACWKARPAYKIISSNPFGGPGLTCD